MHWKLILAFETEGGLVPQIVFKTCKNGKVGKEKASSAVNKNYLNPKHIYALCTLLRLA